MLEPREALSRYGESFRLSSILFGSKGYQKTDSILALQDVISVIDSDDTKKESDNLNKFDLIKIESITRDLLDFISWQLDTFKDIEASNKIPNKYNLEWMLEGKFQILKLCKCVEMIDRLISQLLELLDKNIVSTSSNKTIADDFIEELLNKVNVICESSLKLRKFVTAYKKRLDIAIQYDEISSITMDSIEKEIEDCHATISQINVLSESIVNIPPQVQHYELPTLLSAMTKSSTIHLEIPLLTRDEIQRYDLFKKLSDKISPINASLMFIPQALEQFSDFAKEIYGDSILSLIEKYEFMINDLKKINSSVKKLNVLLVDLKWESALKFVVTQLAGLIDEVDEFINIAIGVDSEKDIVIDDEMKSKLDSVDTAFDVLKRAVGENLIEDERVITLKDELLQKFISLSKKLNSNKQKKRNSNGRKKKLSLPTNSDGEVIINKSADDKPQRRVSSGFKMNLNPILVEEFPMSAKKNPSYISEFKILQDKNINENTPNFTKEKSNNALIKKLVSEMTIGNSSNASSPSQRDSMSTVDSDTSVSEFYADKENSSPGSDGSTLCDNMNLSDKHFDSSPLQHHTVHAVKIKLQSPNPFVTPSYKKTNNDISKNDLSDTPVSRAPRGNSLKYVPLPIGSDDDEDGEQEKSINRYTIGGGLLNIKASKLVSDLNIIKSSISDQEARSPYHVDHFDLIDNYIPESPVVEDLPYDNCNFEYSLQQEKRHSMIPLPTRAESKIDIIQSSQARSRSRSHSRANSRVNTRPNSRVGARSRSPVKGFHCSPNKAAKREKYQSMPTTLNMVKPDMTDRSNSRLEILGSSISNKFGTKPPSTSSNPTSNNSSRRNSRTTTPTSIPKPRPKSVVLSNISNYNDSASFKKSHIRSPSSLVPPTPLKMIKQRVRAQSSLGSRDLIMNTIPGVNGRAIRVRSVSGPSGF